MEQQARAGSPLRSAARAWWVLGLVGLLGVVAGIIVLAQPSISLATLAVIAGVFLLVDGIFEVMWALFDSLENRAIVAIFGAISAIAGVILIRHPFHAVVAIALLLGSWLLVAGILRLIRTFAEPGQSGWSVLVAVFELIAGIVIVSSPGIGVATVALLVGIGWILRGLAMLVVAWTLRAVQHGPPRGATGAPRPAM